MNSTCCNNCNNDTAILPLQTDNRSGLKAVSYRIGEYDDFFRSLKNKLSLHKHLKGLTARDTTDFSIALLDAWSIAADIYTFYQERIINESFLQTATERFSVLELSRLVGYELRPGVAASTYIAFSLESPKATLDAKLPTVNATNLYGGALPVNIDKGLKIQSIPEKGQLPQTFETTETIEARLEWNEIRPRMTLAQEIINDEIIYLEGTKHILKTGDSILIRKEGENLLRTIHEVIKSTDDTLTTIKLKPVVVQPSYQYLYIYSPIIISNLLTQTYFSKTISQEIKKSTIVEKDLKLVKQVNKWTDLELQAGLNQPAITVTKEDEGVFVFRKKAAVFGYNAQQYYIDSEGKQQAANHTWSETSGTINLDNDYDEILDGGFIAIQNPKNTGSTLSFYKIKNVTSGVLSRYGLSSKTTTLKIEPADANSKANWWGPSNNMSYIREALVLAQSEKLPLAGIPDTTPLSGDSIELDKYYPGLKEKQAIAISGEKTELPGILYSEIGIIKSIKIEGGKTIITLFQSLKHQYIRKSVYINANVVHATNGETVQEILGSGDATKVFQKFILKQPPLTYVSASSGPTGIKSTLEIRVNSLLWHEVDFFINAGPTDRVYIVRRDNDGNTTVMFGDGKNGARLPGGNNNVVATYRRGIGKEGVLKAKQISQLTDKPLQVKSAINPVIATGAEDPETIDKARKNATLTILTLDRVVSLQDYEDYATAFAGIVKAHATWARRLNKQQIFLTIAGENGATIETDSDLYKNLIKAIQKSGTNHAPLNLATYTPRFFNLEAGLLIHPDYLPEKVLADAYERISNEYSFEARKFMQPVTYSEVITCLQNTTGVIAVDIDALYRSENSVPEIKHFLNASLPAIGNNSFSGAELLTVAPNGINLKIIQ